MSTGIDAKANVKVEFSITLTLTIGEAKALKAISGYGTKAFLETFYEKMGRYYLEPNETDLILFLEKCNYALPIELAKAETAAKGILEAIQPLKQVLK